MSELLLKIDDLSLAIEGNQILDNINLEIPKAKIITIIGPNGSGKTTLARSILNLIKPNKGSIWFKPNLKIGYMPQKVSLNPNLPLTVIDFLKLEVNCKMSKDLLHDIINEVGITKILSHPLQKISGGEMQRTLLARALLKQPELLILDEPVQGVDINGQVEFYKLIEKLRLEREITSLIISHDLHMVMKNTDYVICLNRHICCEGSPNFVNQQQNFHELFSNEALTNFSVYEHHHDHVHK
jgi:zinc transport system ATP-binding protein